MCPRYFSALNSEEVLAIFEAVRSFEYQKDFGLDYQPVEVKPTTPAATVYLQEGKLVTAMRQWWLLPRWQDDPKPNYKYPTFNARSESIDTKRSYEAPFKNRRCLLPASYFCEYTPKPGSKPRDKKDLWRIEFESGEPMVFAGLWERWRSRDGKDTIIESCTLVTTEANDFMAGLPHERMPVILAPEHWEFWLDPEITTREPFEQLFKPWTGQPLKKTFVEPAGA